MGDPLNTPDFLEAALRRSRASLLDAGFSARVASRVQSQRRRTRLVRALPALMAALGVALAAAFTNDSDVQFARHLPDFSNLLNAFSAFARALSPAVELAQQLGLDPWVLLAGAAILCFALAANRHEPRLTLQL